MRTVIFLNVVQNLNPMRNIVCFIFALRNFAVRLQQAMVGFFLLLNHVREQSIHFQKKGSQVLRLDLECSDC